MESESPLACSQQTVIGSYFEPDEFGPQLPTLFP
jgi:hypothetical protein